MWVVLFTMIFVFIMFRTLFGAVGDGVKFVNKNIKIDRIRTKGIELLDSVGLVKNQVIDSDKINCMLKNRTGEIRLFLTKDMKIHVLNGEGADQDVENIQIFSIDNLNDILSLKVRNNTLLIITEDRSFTIDGIADIAELERFQLLINRYMNKENEGSN